LQRSVLRRQALGLRHWKIERSWRKWI